LRRFAGHGLALDKDFAVSPLPFCPYSRVKPCAFWANTTKHWKLKIKMSSRRDDEDVLAEYGEEEQRRDRFILSFP
jgi:hypothetical protein